MLQYRVVPSDPDAHYFTVTLVVPEAGSEQSFWMPAWIPGSYMIRNFARHILDLQATDATGKPVSLEQIDKQRWQLSGRVRGPVSLHYRVYAWDRSVRAAHLDRSHGYFNGSSLFLAVEGQENDPAEVSLMPPEAPVDGHWRLATSMQRTGGEPWGFGTFRAENYEDLIDHPFEMSGFSPAHFEAGGIRHDVVLSGRYRADVTRLCNDLQKICEQHIGFWGGQPPMSRYLFMTMLTGDGYGGLEHRNSTSLMAKRDDLPQPGMTSPDAGYLNYLGLCSHEYFHSWNVKRLKPRAFIPYDLEREVHTELLWWFEGITSYYDDLGVLRAGCSTVGQYLEQLGQTITRVHRGRGRFRQSIAESSFNAWTRFYLQDENAPNAIVSYYAKGALFALYLDLEIRRRTGNLQTLDDLARAAWSEWRETGMPEDGVPELARRFIHCDLTDVFERGVHSRDDLPLAEVLADFGITLEWGAPVNLSVPGGKKAFLSTARQPVSLGAVFDPHNAGARVRALLEESPAQTAGLSAGDVIIAIDHLQVDHQTIDKQVARFLPGDRLSVHYFRDDELRSTEVTLAKAPETTCVLSVADSDRARRWLGSDVRFSPDNQPD